MGMSMFNTPAQLGAPDRLRRFTGAVRPGGCAVMFLLAQMTGLVLAAATPPRRFGSGPLTRSVQNETDAAIARAQKGLIDAQAVDGSWGGQSPYLTAVCALAVSGDGESLPKANADARARAVRWLAANPATNTPAMQPLRAIAWRNLALQVLGGGKTTRNPHLDAPLTTCSNTLTEFAVLETRIVCGGQPPATGMPACATNPAETAIRAAQWQVSRVAVREHLQAVARGWSSPKLQFWRETLAQRAWWLARTINRQANGVLELSPTLMIDWRRDLAGYWVNQQRITPQGGGQWLSDAVTPVEETAFAILLLREL